MSALADSISFDLKRQVLRADLFFNLYKFIKRIFRFKPFYIKIYNFINNSVCFRREAVKTISINPTMLVSVSGKNSDERWSAEELLLLFPDWFIGQRLKFYQLFNLFKLRIFVNEDRAGYNSRRNDPAVTHRKTICSFYFNCFFENRISNVYSF